MTLITLNITWWKGRFWVYCLHYNLMLDVCNNLKGQENCYVLYLWRRHHKYSSMEWFGRPTISQPSNYWSWLFDTIILANSTIRLGPRWSWWCANSRPQYKVMQCHKTRRFNSTIQGNTMPRYKAIQCHNTRQYHNIRLYNSTIQGNKRQLMDDGSAKQNLPNSFMNLGWILWIGIFFSPAFFTCSNKLSEYQWYQDQRGRNNRQDWPPRAGANPWSPFVTAALAVVLRKAVASRENDSLIVAGNFTVNCTWSWCFTDSLSPRWFPFSVYLFDERSSHSLFATRLIRVNLNFVDHAHFKYAKC